MIPHSIQHSSEPTSNAERAALQRVEPRALRTFTPTQAVLARSAGVYHWTPEGRRLFDFTSGVLVSNLGHNPLSWMRRFFQSMGWPTAGFADASTKGVPHRENPVPSNVPEGYYPAMAMTAYNAVTPIEIEASRRLIEVMRKQSYGQRMEQVMWAASGSEAIQKALWAAQARDRSRSMILATRFGFHGKKGIAAAVTGSETDADRDPRVRFISFPMQDYRDISDRNRPFDPTPHQKELDALLHQFGGKIGTLITEPYLGGGGSYHPPKAYLQLLDRFCKANDIVFILDEVQANFGRTRNLFAYETYEIEPDIVVLGKGLGNGVPVAASVGRSEIFGALEYGEGSDTWSANPLQCASVLATLDEFAATDVMGHVRSVSAVIEKGLEELKRLPFIEAVRGEYGGMVWGVEMKDFGSRTAGEWANQFVLACYQGDGPSGEGIHILGPLARKVVRISPPLTITVEEATFALQLMQRSAGKMVETPIPTPALVG